MSLQVNDSGALYNNVPAFRPHRPACTQVYKANNDGLLKHHLLNVKNLSTTPRIPNLKKKTVPVNGTRSLIVCPSIDAYVIHGKKNR